MKTKISIILICLISKIYGQCFEKISAGYKYTTAIKFDNTFCAWGNNDFGVLGNGTNIPQNLPCEIFNNCSSISSGYEHNLAIKLDGTLWTWGRNNYGQLGNGSNLNNYIPTQIGIDTNWVKISTRDLFSFAIKNDGTLWAWGNNSYGQLGDGTCLSKDVPTQIGTDNYWLNIDGKGRYSLAVKIDNSLWGWGDGQDFGNISVPTQIGIETNWQRVSSGGIHNVALKTDGTLWTWGNNYYGELGNGTFINNEIPSQIGIDNDWQEISTSSDSFSLAIKSDGTLWSWGKNNFGQLGDGTSINKNIPTQIGNDTNWHKINCGDTHSVALKNDGSLWVWGNNDYSMFGNNSSIGSFIPINITCPTSLSIDVINVENEIKIYPNPFQDVLLIKFDTIDNGLIEVYNMFGIKILKQNFKNNLISEINLNDQPTGTYMIKISYGNQIVFRKIIKI